MKNLSLALNGLLCIAVGVLYYLHFSSGAPETKLQTPQNDNLTLAYINSDTVLKHYAYFKTNRDRIEAKGKKMEQDLKARAKSLQDDFDLYQRTANNMTRGQAMATEEDLTKKRQNLQMYQEGLQQQMTAEQEKMVKELYNRVTTYLKEYGQARGLQIVLKFDASSDLLYAGETLDISRDVIEGLNSSYQKESAPQDSAGTRKK